MYCLVAVLVSWVYYYIISLLWVGCLGWSFWVGCCRLVIVDWSLWVSCCRLVAVGQLLWVGCCRLVIMGWSS